MHPVPPLAAAASPVVTSLPFSVASPAAAVPSVDVTYSLSEPYVSNRSLVFQESEAPFAFMADDAIPVGSEALGSGLSPWTRESRL